MQALIRFPDRAHPPPLIASHEQGRESLKDAVCLTLPHTSSHLAAPESEAQRSCDLLMVI